MTNNKFSNIDSIINEVIAAYDKYGSDSHTFNHLYSKHHQVMSQYKNDVLRKNAYKTVTLTGRLARRGDGDDENLNLITPAYINGVKVEHIHVYDEVLENAEINPITGNFIVENLKVYRFRRDASRNRYAHLANMGLKPKSAPKWSDRNEI